MSNESNLRHKEIILGTLVDYININNSLNNIMIKTYVAIRRMEDELRNEREKIKK